MMLNQSIKEIFGLELKTSCIGCGLDSRKIKKSMMFVAFKGVHSDGHDHVDDAIANGAVCVIGENSDFQCSVPYISVTDLQDALWQLAGNYRDLIPAHVIALTGSVGKTTTKNMLYQVLQLSADVHATAGNQNNEWGVPLTVLNTPLNSGYLIVECGARLPGDIAKLMSIVRPQTTMITKIAESHLETFGSLAKIAATKSEILNGVGTAIVRQDEYEHYNWSTKRDLLFVSDDINQEGGYELVQDIAGYVVNMNMRGMTHTIETNIQFHHIAENAAMVVRLATSLGMPQAQIQSVLMHLASSQGRMQQHEMRGLKIIDDTYNASPLSVKAAIDALKHYDGEKMIILGQMSELGPLSDDVHKDIVSYAQMTGIGSIVTYGAAYSQIASTAVSHEPDDDELKDIIYRDSISTVLIKGSRAMKMERLVNLLKESVVTEDG